MATRARAIAALVAYLDLPATRILDAGCGLGWMRKPLLRAFPKATYVGLEVSEHLCQRFGWINRSLADFRPRGRFDLVICHDVLQYLPQTEARRAMANLVRVCKGVLYFHVPTKQDWQRNADLSVSDPDIHLRDGEWYRRQLARGFHALGFGIYVKHDVPFAQWELEQVE
jgi:SAM-dependent methyltransferase